MKKTFQVIIYIFAAIGFVLVAVYASVELGITNEEGIIDSQRAYFKDKIGAKEEFANIAQSEEWKVLREAMSKDADVIRKASQLAQVSPRLIASVLIVEQLRLFNSEREVFKAVFAPLKILGNQSQFSWGVMGIKQDTAKEIESNLKNSSSTYYLGPDFENILEFSSDDADTERFMRLTNEDDRYYSYLYGALMLKQIMMQWQKAGFPINDQPGIVATLFNIGFGNSKPHADPKIGGAVIEIGNYTYSFGGLAELFYYSDELANEF